MRLGILYICIHGAEKLRKNGFLFIFIPGNTKNLKKIARCSLAIGHVITDERSETICIRNKSNSLIFILFALNICSDLIYFLLKKEKTRRAINSFLKQIFTIISVCWHSIQTRNFRLAAFESLVFISKEKITLLNFNFIIILS